MFTALFQKQTWPDQTWQLLRMNKTKIKYFSMTLDTNTSGNNSLLTDWKSKIICITQLIEAAEKPLGSQHQEIWSRSVDKESVHKEA